MTDFMMLCTGLLVLLVLVLTGNWNAKKLAASPAMPLAWAGAAWQASKCACRVAASTLPREPIATMRGQGVSPPQSPSNEMSTRLPTTCRIVRRAGSSAV